jgi:uncharacterized paraquat-inducible protein A
MEDKVVSCPQCSTNNRLKSSAEDKAPVCGKCKSPLPWMSKAPISASDGS